MDSHEVASIVCPQCFASLPASAERCSACGASTSSSAAAPVPAKPGSATPAPATPVRLRLQERGWFVLLTVFGAALFLGYPMLWHCPAFSRRTKWVLSVLVAVETVLVFWLFFVAMRWSYGRIVDAW